MEKMEAKLSHMRGYLLRLARHCAHCTRLKRDYHLAYALLMDPEYGIMDNFMPQTLSQVPQLLKATKSDPDYPSLQEALASPMRQEFLDAMVVEIQELESHNTWTLVRKDSLPEGANILPSTWALRIKRFPDGQFCKIKG